MPTNPAEVIVIASIQVIALLAVPAAATFATIFPSNNCKAEASLLDEPIYSHRLSEESKYAL